MKRGDNDDPGFTSGFTDLLCAIAVLAVFAFIGVLLAWRG